MKKWSHKRGVTSIEGGNLLVFYYLIPFDICPDWRVSLWWEWSNKRRATVQKVGFVWLYDV